MTASTGFILAAIFTAIIYFIATFDRNEPKTN